jgi:hypothetical protein
MDMFCNFLLPSDSVPQFHYVRFLIILFSHEVYFFLLYNFLKLFPFLTIYTYYQAYLLLHYSLYSTSFFVLITLAATSHMSCCVYRLTFQHIDALCCYTVTSLVV